MPEEATFATFDRAHPEVWALFEDFTMGLIRRGRAHHSSDEVLHRVRWETSAGAREPDYEINDDWSVYYARKFHQRHPRHAGFFPMTAD